MIKLFFLKVSLDIAGGVFKHQGVYAIGKTIDRDDNLLLDRSVHHGIVNQQPIRIVKADADIAKTPAETDMNGIVLHPSRDVFGTSIVIQSSQQIN